MKDFFSIPVLHLIFLFSVASAISSNKVIFVSNETCILRVDPLNNGSSSAVICQNNGNIVALDVDPIKGYMFWSNNAPPWTGLYSSKVDGTEITKIISNDILEVNGLALDTRSSTLYWTDAQLRRIDSAYYDGSNRRTIIISNLGNPRGIIIDYENNTIIWNDQLTRLIEMSLLDGSGRQIVLSSNITWPNQMALVYIKNEKKIYFIDAYDKCLKSFPLYRSSSTPLTDASVITIELNMTRFQSTNQLPFGLSLDRTDWLAYITVWSGCSLYRFNFSDSTIVEINHAPLGKEVLYNCYFYSGEAIDKQSTGQSNVSESSCVLPMKGGCSHICIAYPNPQKYRCACPTYEMLSLSFDGKQCSAPSDILFYAETEYGYIGWLDPNSDLNYRQDLHIAAKSPRPVAVTYDPIQQVLYWSDVQERRIYKKSLFIQNSIQVFLDSSQGLGFIDGLFLDWRNRRLYFANEDSTTINAVNYAWHRLESVSLDGSGRKNIDIDAQLPRGIWVDPSSSTLYLTDWGDRARLLQSSLNGEIKKEILIGLENPNSVVVLRNGIIVVVDSMYKTSSKLNKSLSTNTTSPVLWMAKVVPISNTTSWNWVQTRIQKLKIPYSLAVSTSSGESSTGSKSQMVYISDWGSSTIWSYDPESGNISVIISSNLGQPSGLFHSTLFQTINETSTMCTSSACKNVCIVSEFNATTTFPSCSCPSNKPNIWAAQSQTCQKPNNFLLVADMNNVVMMGLEVKGDRTVYDVVEGQFYNSYSAFVLDAINSRYFFSDVNGGVLLMGQLNPLSTTINQLPDIIYRPIHIIDDIILNGTSFYWTSYKDGLIVKADLTTNSIINSHVVLATNLDKPKSLALDVDRNLVYWTSDSQTQPGLNWFKIDIYNSSSSSQRINVSGLVRPSALFVDRETDVLYVLDSVIGTVIRCTLQNLDPGNCTTYANLVGSGPFYSFLIFGGTIIFYSDWGRRGVYSFNRANNGTQLVLGGLMRPTRFVLNYNVANITDQCLGKSCQYGCIGVPGGYQCICSSNQILASDGIQCIDGKTNYANLKPYFLFCPTDQVSTTSNTSQTFWWSDPITGPFPASLNGLPMTSNIVPGVTLKPGDNSVVIYNKTNPEGLTANCTFQLSLIKANYTCSELPLVDNGYFLCNDVVGISNGLKVTNCKLICNTGTIPLNSQTDSVTRQCSNNNMIWTPPFTSGSVFCLKNYPQQKQNLITINFLEACPNLNSSDSINKFQTKFFNALSFTLYSWNLCSESTLFISQNSNYRSNLCDPRNFNLVPCSGTGGVNSNVVIGDVKERRKRQANNVNGVRPAVSIGLQDYPGISTAMSRLQQIIRTNQMSIKLDEGNGIFTADGYQAISLPLQCPVNTLLLPDQTCAECPPGTIFSAFNQTCIICQIGTYQPLSSQSTCLPCPSPANFSSTGSINIKQCVISPLTPQLPSSPPSANNNSNYDLLIGLIVGLGGGLLVLLAVVLGILCYREKKLEKEMTMRQARARGARDTFSNRAYNNWSMVDNLRLGNYRSAKTEPTLTSYNPNPTMRSGSDKDMTARMSIGDEEEDNVYSGRGNNLEFLPMSVENRGILKNNNNSRGHNNNGFYSITHV